MNVTQNQQFVIIFTQGKDSIRAITTAVAATVLIGLGSAVFGPVFASVLIPSNGNLIIFSGVLLLFGMMVGFTLFGIYKLIYKFQREALFKEVLTGDAFSIQYLVIDGRYFHGRKSSNNEYVRGEVVCISKTYVAGSVRERYMVRLSEE